MAPPPSKRSSNGQGSKPGSKKKTSRKTSKRRPKAEIAERPRLLSKREKYVAAATSQAEPQEHKLFASVSASDAKVIKAFAIDAARMLADDKCEDVQLLAVGGISQVTDYIIIASGTSDRQMSSSADDMEDVGAKHGWKTFRRHDDDRTTWIVVDFVDVVIHIFEPNTRAHYDLEMLWADADRLEWERPDQIKRNRAGLD